MNSTYDERERGSMSGIQTNTNPIKLANKIIVKLKIIGLRNVLDAPQKTLLFYKGREKGNFKLTF